MVVELRDITKIYPGASRRVNNRVNLSLRPGEILCLAGENGAGKTTLMKILYGVEQPTAGEILVRGKPVKIPNPLTANRLGIGMVYQHFMLFPELTVAQNVVMGIEPRVGGIFYNHRKALSSVDAVIKAHYFSIEADKPVKDLTVGQMQQVEIIKLLYRNVDVLILDEPTAVLTRQEIVSLFKNLRALTSAGKSIILITHKLPEIKEISNRVAVMRQGTLVGLRETTEIDEQAISRMIIGSSEETAAADPDTALAAGLVPGTISDTVPAATPVIAFDKVTVKRRGQSRLLLDRLSFTVHEGEILGFAGVGGNGLGVLEALLGGFLPLVSGTISHRGKDISHLHSRDLRRGGLAYVPADRLRVGSAPEATVTENLIMNRRRDFTPRFFFDTPRVNSFTADLIHRFDIAGSEGQLAGTLSGGNIQKLILAREIDQFRDYIVFSEPGWGLDIVATAYVYHEIRKLREKGAAVLLISTNLDEILALADRIIVLYRGAIAVELRDIKSRTNTNVLKEEIGAYMLGRKPQQEAGAVGVNRE